MMKVYAPVSRISFQFLFNFLLIFRRYNLLSRLPISSSNKSLNREHLSIETLLKGHLYLADADLLKPALARQGVEITSLLSQLIFDVTELTSSMATVGNRDNHKLGDPTKIYTTKLILRLALHFYEKASCYNNHMF